MLRDLPTRARWYILSVIALGAVTFALLVPKAQFTPIIPFVFLVLLSSLTSAFKVQLPIASGSRRSREAANHLYQRLGFERRETNVYRLSI